MTRPTVLRVIARNGCRQQRDGLDSTTFLGRVSAPFTPRLNGERHRRARVSLDELIRRALCDDVGGGTRSWPRRQDRRSLTDR
jgi:hypothetical protein